MRRFHVDVCHGPFMVRTAMGTPGQSIWEVEKLLIPLRSVRTPGERIRPPVITVLLILVNVAVFLYQLHSSRVRHRPLGAIYGAIPRELTHLNRWEGIVIGRDRIRPLPVQPIVIRDPQGKEETHYVDLYTWASLDLYDYVVKPRFYKPKILERGNPPRYRTISKLPVHLSLLFSLFLHGGWIHIVSNMLYLFAFGPNVEHSMGHFRYLLFYLLCGVLATIGFVLANVNSPVPLIGASGAIAGVMGAHFVAFPGARIRCIFFIFLVSLPAVIVLFPWILSQIAHMTYDQGESSVAWVAHVAGFLTGMFLMRKFRRSWPSPPPLLRPNPPTW